jgi:hypothetical protein
MKKTLRTIQPIGKNPITAPRMLARIASPDGIVNRKTAMMMATSSAITAARWVLTEPVAQDKQRHHGDGGGNRRQDGIAERIVDLLPHALLPKVLGPYFPIFGPRERMNVERFPDK